MKGQKEGWKGKDRSEIVGVELNCESAAQLICSRSLPAMKFIFMMLQQHEHGSI